MSNLIGEFFGTMILVLFGVGTCANLNLKKSFALGGGWICIVLGWGLAVTLGVFTAQVLGAPQADLNPAVTLAKTFLGIYTIPQMLAAIVIQTAGGILGAIFVYLVFLGHWKETPGNKIGIFSTAPAAGGMWHGFLSETICSFLMMFCIMIIFSKPVGDLPCGFGPLCVGLVIMAIGCSLGGSSGYAMNMARDLGPRIAFSILPIPDKGPANWKYAWVPCIAPMFGTTLAALLIKAFGLA